LNIRCERCSTTYELDETLLAPEGSPVQCTKCQHVFTAVPPRTAGRTLVGVPAAPPPRPVAPRPPPPEVQPGPARQGPAIYRPSAPSAPSSIRSPRPHRDTMGTFEARLKANARLRWVVPLVVVVIALAAAAAWVFVDRRVDPAAERRHSEAMALVALDDIESLEKATQVLDDLGKSGAGIRSIEADRALAQLLLATGLLEDVAVPAQRLALKVAERDRLAATQPPPPPETLAALSAEVEALRVQVEPRQATARTLTERAYAALRQSSGDGGGEIAVARALAIHFAATGDREQALRFIRATAGAADRDPWMMLAEAWLDSREEGREPRERAIAKLSALIAAHPEIVRARFLLARTQAALGKREAAAATLDGLLTASPRHRRAIRLRGELVAPPAQQQAAPLAPAQVVPRPAAPAFVPAPAGAPAQGAVPAARVVPPAAPPGAAPAPGAPRPVVAPVTAAPKPPPAVAPGLPKPAPAPAPAVVPVSPKPMTAPAPAPAVVPAPAAAPAAPVAPAPTRAAPTPAAEQKRPGDDG
jgi:predicted Zn finger-like uncharacterized protein